MIVTTAAYDANLERELIFPKWKILSFNPTTDTWADIIAGTYVQTPVDLTQYVTNIEHSFDRLQVSMVDDANLVFHPDAGILRTALAQGRIIRVKEGFEGLAETDWVWTFSGTLEGSYAWTYQRGEQINVSFTAFSRSNNQAWKRRNVSSRNYTVGSDWASMFMNVVKDVMLLDSREVVVPEPWGVLFDKNSNQVVNMPPWDAMEQLMFGIQARPWFNGKGELDLYYTTQNRTTLILTNDNYLRKYEARGSGSETINKVILTFLSNELSRVDGPDQVLGTAMVTTGFFRADQNIDVYYSDERKVRSDNPRLHVIQSVNSGLLPVGDETMVKIDEFHVNISVQISAWVPILTAMLAGEYLALSAVPEEVVSAGVVASAGLTVPPTKSLPQAILLIAIMLIMMSIGTGQYEVWGTPYEMVYLEQQAIAIKAGTEFWQERELTIRNDFISTTEQARPLAVNQLHYEVMKENPRTLLLRYDPRIEPGDIIQLSSEVRVYVESVSRKLARNSSDVAAMTVSGYRTVF